METTLGASNLILLLVALYLTFKIWPRIKQFIQTMCTRFRPDQYVPAGDDPPAAIQLLLEAGAEEIEPLGFTHQLAYDAVNREVSLRCHLFLGEEPGTSAIVAPPLLPESAPYDLFFQTRFRSPNGEEFDCESVAGFANLLGPESRPHQQSFENTSGGQLWDIHCQRVRDYEAKGNQKVLEAIDPGTYFETANAKNAELFETLYEHGHCKRVGDGSYRLTAKAAGNMVKRAQAAATAPNVEPPLETSAEIEAARCSVVRINEENHPAQPGYLILLAISFVAFFIAFGLWLGFDVAVFISVVIFIHELGHWLGMKLCGYRNPRIFFLPMLGGVAVGKKNNPSTLQELIVLLLGPLPGLAIGIAIISAEVVGAMETTWIFRLGWYFCIINYFNLLPIMPLDGGRIIHALFMRRIPRLQFLFALISTAAMAIGAFYLRSPLLGVFAFFGLFRLAAVWFTGSIEKVVEPQLKSTPPDPDEITLAVVKAIRATPKAEPQLPPNVAIGRVNQIVESLMKAKPSIPVAAAGTAIYLLSLGLPMFIYLILYFNAPNRPDSEPTSSAPEEELESERPQ